MLSVLLPVGSIRLSSAAIIFGMIFYLLFWTREQTFSAYITVTSCCGIVYRWLDLVALHQPEKDFWRASGKGDSESKSLSRAPESRVAKLMWFSSLWNTARFALSRLYA